MIDVVLPHDHVWLRLVKPHYDDPFGTRHAQRRGGRWNPPASWPTLYVNEDMSSVHAQLRRLFLGRGIEPDDLDDGAPVLLAAATLPARQHVADIVSDGGVVAAGLPGTYPLDHRRREVAHDVTREVGEQANASGLRGVWCRSATQVGRELAWFPAPRATARPVWPHPRPFGSWRHATTLDDVDRHDDTHTAPGRGRPPE